MRFAMLIFCRPFFFNKCNLLTVAWNWVMIR